MTISSSSTATSTTTAAKTPPTMIDDTRFFNVPPLSLDDIDNIDGEDDEIDFEAIARQMVIKCISEIEHADVLKNMQHSGHEDYDKSISDSLYTGRLGVLVYLSLRFASCINDVNESHLRQAFLSKAMIVAQHILQRSTENELVVGSKGTKFRVSLLEGNYVGAACLLVHTLILSGGNAEINNRSYALQYGNHLVDQLTSICCTNHTYLKHTECEVLYGRSGALHAILYLKQILNDTEFAYNFVIDVTIRILKVGLQTSKEYYQDHDNEDTPINSRLPLLWKWHDKVYLGAAHGIVGILHTLLYLTPMEWVQVEYVLPGAKERIKETIDILISPSSPYMFKDTGNLRSSIKKKKKQHSHSGNDSNNCCVSSETDRLVHWCHGAPGLCIMLIKASEVFYSQTRPLDNPYITYASEIAQDVIYKRGLLKKGVGLCHGISGNAYVFLSLSRYFCNVMMKNKNKNGKDNDDIKPSSTTATTKEAAEEEKLIAAHDTATAAAAVDNDDASITAEDATGTDGAAEIDAGAYYENIWIKSAKQYAMFAIQNMATLEVVPDNPYSLYQGLGGLACLCLDLGMIQNAKIQYCEQQAAAAAEAGPAAGEIGANSGSLPLYPPPFFPLYEHNL